MSDKKLKRNRIRCRLCDDVIESKHTHDFVSCKCGGVFVDGGLDYQRCGWSNSSHEPEDDIDFSLTEWEPETTAQR